VPQGSREIYIGATSDISARPEWEPRPGRVEALQRAATALFDEGLARRIPRILLGFRPTTEDGYPLIGETSVPGLFVLSGTRRDGLHLSPVYARDMAERILTGTGFIGGFEPERR
jgi:glycine/D-amino acid oxidase-like deaminating enzyme